MTPFRFNPQSWLGLFTSNGGKRQSKSAKRAVRRRGTLGFESLESRTMMAADLAEVFGVVRIDPQGDGNVANDQYVSGATVSLYRDNGDNVFGGSDQLAKAAVQTTVQGQYRFQGLTAGRYFVKVELPPDSQFKAGESVQIIDISAADAGGVLGPTIDGFGTFQEAIARPTQTPSQSQQSDAAVMGGERDMFVEITNGTDSYSSVSMVSGGGLMRLSSDSVVKGNAKIIWDGQDGSPTGLNAIGLNGLNFKTHNGNTMTGIALKSGADHPNSIIKLRVYTDSNHWSEFTTTVPDTADGSATGLAVFNFLDSPTASQGGGADFGSVGAVELTFEGVTAVDGQVSLIGLIGMSNKQANFTAYPQLSLGDTVWADKNNDGEQNAGETGIAGVKLNLYVDTNNDNAYSPGTDVAAGTVNTDSSGNYLFTGLFPGKYVVQVDPVNFNPGGPLNGLYSSSGNDPAADPDDNVDLDDNGLPLAGFGVVSQALTLVGGQSGSNPNRNTTVDFGFFGFDVSLTKTADKSVVSPGETLTYTVTIQNLGPTTARQAWFVDDYPADVIVKSITASNGAQLHSNGVSYMGNLGDMAPGSTITIVMQTEVKASATKKLWNYARVEVADEVNISNNKDDVGTPLVPKIDLMVDKSDSKDPVTQGETFSYTLKVTNNGPSDATGVMLTDSLPPGVAFVDSSAPNVSTISGQLRFNLGSLANGASSSVTVRVRVNDDFEGTLLNQTDVIGDQMEITMANNVDTEPTTVVAKPVTIGGFVYVDKNNNGIKEAGEKPISGVKVTLEGNLTNGQAISPIDVYTKADGSYLFTGLKAGIYRLIETQPTKYKDGKDTPGDNGDSVQTIADGISLESQDLSQPGDLDQFSGLIMEPGYHARDYNFGELAVSSSKASFLGRARW